MAITSHFQDTAHGTRSIADQIEARTNPNFITSLARGLAVIRAFSDLSPPHTIARIGQHTGISRAAVRRCLYTLKQLGYVDVDRHLFTLRPKVLTLGHVYLASTPLALTAQPCLDKVSHILSESCSLAVFDDNEVLYLARSDSSRVMTVSLDAGTRLPAYCTSLGRVLLAHLSDEDICCYLAQTPLIAYTEHTITEPAQLRSILSHVRQDRYAVNSEEFEIGLRSIAVPVQGTSGRVQAAMMVGAQAAAVSSSYMVDKFLPVMRQAAADIAHLLP